MKKLIFICLFFCLLSGFAAAEECHFVVLDLTHSWRVEQWIETGEHVNYDELKPEDVDLGSKVRELNFLIEHFGYEKRTLVNDIEHSLFGILDICESE